MCFAIISLAIEFNSLPKGVFTSYIFAVVIYSLVLEVTITLKLLSVLNTAIICSTKEAPIEN